MAIDRWVGGARVWQQWLCSCWWVGVRGAGRTRHVCALRCVTPPCPCPLLQPNRAHRQTQHTQHPQDTPYDTRMNTHTTDTRHTRTHQTHTHARTNERTHTHIVVGGANVSCATCQHLYTRLHARPLVTSMALGTGAEHAGAERGCSRKPYDYCRPRAAWCAWIASCRTFCGWCY